MKMTGEMVRDSFMLSFIFLYIVSVLINMNI
nr:MAG TPA: hypothetical protein [Caudoviricetes sp.]